MDLKQLVNFHFTNQLFNNSSGSGSSSGTNSLKYAFLGFIGIQMIDILMGNLSKVGVLVKNGLETYMHNRIKKVSTTLTFTSHIEFYRDYSNTDETQTYVDAIIYHISQLNSVIKLQHRKIYIVNSMDEFEITKDIKGKVKRIQEKENNINEIVFQIYSYNLSLTKLREWADNVYEVYKTELQTGFGKYKFYFNHKIGGSNLPFDSQHLIFEMNKFETNKSLSNLFGEQIQTVTERIKLFQNDKEWYENKGIPYTFGLLLHGVPGCGKTSLIKAISKDTQRHILNIKLSSSITLTQLRNLFYSDKIKIFTDTNTPLHYITIPVEQRIYVMEDVDCLTSLLNQRSTKQEEILSEEGVKAIKMLGKERWEQMKNLNTDKVTLSDILNIIDGVLETPGRILILTTNYPEKLDTALLRPGRIDLLVNFTECNTLQLRQMFEHFYDDKFNFNYSLLENAYTPAYIQEIFLRYMKNPQKAFDFLYKNLPVNIDETLFKSSTPPPTRTYIETQPTRNSERLSQSYTGDKLMYDIMNNDELITNIETENDDSELSQSMYVTSKSWGIPKPNTSNYNKFTTIPLNKSTESENNLPSTVSYITFKDDDMFI